jgi:hypothetical protein
MSGMDKHAVNERAAQVLRIGWLSAGDAPYPYQLSAA